MATHLPSHGWQPTILTVDQDTFSQTDSTYAADTMSQFETIHAKGAEPFGLYRTFMGKPADMPLQSSDVISRTNRSLRHRISIWIRMNLFIPDARVGWFWSATRRARIQLADRHFDAILSIGPPHTAQLVGKKLARMFSAPHIPVLIDPWTTIVYYKDFKRNPITRSIDRALERRVLEQAARVVFVTDSMKKDYISQYPAIADRSHVLYWGYDERPFATLEHLAPHPSPTLVHAGNLFDYQNPTQLWQTIRQRNDQGQELRLLFIGSVGPAVRASIERAGLAPLTSYLGFLSYNRMIQELLRATYVMVCASEKRHVPGKLFEYLRSGKPILAFGDDNEEVSSILRRTGAGRLLPFSDDAASFFEDHERPARDWDTVRSFDRTSIAAALATTLGEVSASSGGTAPTSV